ncbi:prepilin-type N-terminal cleavage/methylation domain-containing protein [Chitinimonas viridis]|uniref:Prepilin-type N-terminal cleavage/methylation domain-containing protein n=1 Tax=Chitinimonas viridis TaxID=664880 RepID=A0ABT8B318_9NEIS|nr:prepilin-type N-terminal cleavage/methylation domain-containing protein [Chitinimonas viridis]MDN3575938.1 prepilin-type N-terminal cleavage/methylation domain-containing protein [Chitinimonas viridis]
MNSIARKQQGFTLIEIAIVLVIIGLLLGGVLKGQEMIENGKIKNMINDLNGTAAAMTSYRDRYRALPGDDIAALPARGWAAAVAGDGNGLVGAAAANPFTTNGENINFWRDLRYAGLVAGDPAIATVALGGLPTHAGSGLMGVTRGVQGMAGAVVCMGNVSGKYALSIDQQLDDGANSTGTIRAALGVAGNNTAPVAAIPNPAAYNETLSYTVCRAL